MRILKLPYVYCYISDVAQEVISAARTLVSQATGNLSHEDYIGGGLSYGDIFSTECKGNSDWTVIQTIGCDYHKDRMYVEDIGVTALLCLESDSHVFYVDDGKSPAKSLVLNAGEVLFFDSNKMHSLRGDAQAAPFLGLLIDIADREKENIPCSSL